MTQYCWDTEVDHHNLFEEKNILLLLIRIMSNFVMDTYNYYNIDFYLFRNISGESSFNKYVV